VCYTMHCNVRAVRCCKGKHICDVCAKIISIRCPFCRQRMLRDSRSIVILRNNIPSSKIGKIVFSSPVYTVMRMYV
jgi:hypothetical protein